MDQMGMGNGAFPFFKREMNAFSDDFVCYFSSNDEQIEFFSCSYKLNTLNLDFLLFSSLN